MKQRILNALKERAEEARQYGIPQFVLGLHDAIEIVERVYEEGEGVGDN